MTSNVPNQGARRSRLTDSDRVLIAQCKAERKRMREEQAELKRLHKKITRQIEEIGDKSLARKFGVSDSTIGLIPVAGV